MEQVFHYSPKQNMIILFGDFNAKLGKEDVCKPTTRNEILHENSTDKDVRIVKFVTSKTLVVKNTTFPHCNFHKHNHTSLDGTTYNQVDHVLLDRR
jgi:uncharacterized metal-binding protein